MADLPNTDPDFTTAHRLYKRCAYETLKQMRMQQTAKAWIDLADAIAAVWEDSDKASE